jgi:cytochrome P450
MPRSDHRDVAPVFRAALMRLDFPSAEPDARAAFRAVLEQMAADSSGRPEAGIHPRDYWGVMLLPALARVFLGLEPARPEVGRIGRQVPKLELGRGGGPLWRRQVREALDTTADVLRNATESEGPAPGSALAHLLAAEPALFDDPTLTKNLILILRLAYGDLTGLFDWLFKMLSDHPDRLAQLREEGPAAANTVPASAGATDAVSASPVAGTAAGGVNGHPPTLAERIVMETVRLEQSEFLYRKVIRPVRLDDVVLPAGWLLRVCIQESHRSADVFEEPDRFDPDRFARRAFSRAEYSPFGIDSHACMGARLAVSLGSVFVEELARFEWKVLRDGPIERDGNRHRYHWRPNRRLRVLISPAAVDGAVTSASAAGSEGVREPRSRAAPSPR